MFVVVGSMIAFKKVLAKYEDFELCQFYTLHHILFIPIFWSKGIGLFHPKMKNKYYELDGTLEKRLLKLPKNSQSELYLKEIKNYNTEQGKKHLHYIEHKEEYDKKENEEFIKFLKGVGIFLGIAILLIIIKSIFF